MSLSVSVNENLLEPKQAAFILGCSPIQVRRLILKGALAAYRIGKRYKIERTAVEAFREQSKVAPEAFK